jgi:WD40 repeat protein
VCAQPLPRSASATARRGVLNPRLSLYSATGGSPGENTMAERENVFSQLVERRIRGGKLQYNRHWVEKLSPCMKLRHHRGCVNSLNFSPSGKFLLSGSDDSSLCLWELDLLRAQFRPGHTANIYCAVFDETNEKTVFSCDRSGWFIQSNLETQTPERKYDCNLGVPIKRIAQKEHCSFICTLNGSIHRYDQREAHSRHCTPNDCRSKFCWFEEGNFF